MQNTFDPYHQWLGIPQDEQPPHYYRLLAISLFEADPNVIDNAADRTMMQLRTLSLGPNGTLAQKLLNEVSAARVCLLNPEQRLRYDNRLAALSSPLQETIPLVAVPLPLPIALPPRMATASRPSPRPPSNRSPKPKSSGAFEIFKVIAGGLLGLVIAQAVLFYAVNVDIFGIMRRLHGKAKQVDPPVTASNPSITPPVTPRPSPPNSPAAIPWTQSFVPPPLPTSPSPFPPPPLAALPSPSSPSPPTPPVRSSQPGDIPLEIGGQTPLQPADALGMLPRGVELPPPIDTAPRKLLPLGVAEIPELELTSLHAAIPKDAAFMLERVKTRAEWLVSYCPNVAENSPVTQEIARFYAKENGLWYQWGESLSDKEIRPQVRNCRLNVKFGRESKSIALRETRKTARLVIDLSKPLNVQELELADLPSDKSLAIRFGDLGQFSRGANWKNGNSSVTLGKTAIIEFGQAAGARLDFSLTKKTGGTLAVTMRPTFLEQKQPREMTLTRLAEMESSIPNGIAKDQNSLQAYRSQLSSLSSDLSSAQSSSASTLRETAAKQQRVTRIRSDISRIGSRINSLERQIFQNQARQKNLPEMRSFLEELHQKAAIDITVESGSGADALVLVESASS